MKNLNSIVEQTFDPIDNLTLIEDDKIQFTATSLMLEIIECTEENETI